MSQEVHVAKVSKIQRSSDIFKGESPNNRRSVSRYLKDTQSDKDPVGTRYGDNVEFHGNISPRCGTIQALGEMDSPDHTQRDTTESDNNISSCSTLDIVNKVDNLTVQHLETQVRELSQRLQQAENERTDMQRQLEESHNEKEQCFKRLEIVSAAHECRITEMHCVIAELSKKLRTKQENIIEEEQEPECSEISFQEGSVYNSELNLTNPDAECQTDPMEEIAAERYANVDDNLCANMIDDLNINETSSKAQVEALQEEVLHLKAQIALLQAEMANSRPDDDAVVEEPPTVEYFDEEVEANESNCSLDQLRYEDKNENDALNYFKTAEISEFMSPLKQSEALTSPQKEPPRLKVAERVKLHCASKKGSAITSDDINNLANNERHPTIVGSYVNDEQRENELQRLQRQLDLSKIQCSVLSLTLDECKEHCEHLYLLCGKYESNAIALQLAVNCSDRAIEAYDVMLALLESKLVLMNEKTASAEESRKAVESVARHLLDRLESEKNLCENSLGPWQNTFSLPNTVCKPWTLEDDNRLRYHVSKLKGRRSTIQNTIVNLESPFSDFYETARLKCMEKSKQMSGSLEKGTHLDLEMAVLMEETLILREDNHTLRTKELIADKERQYAMDRVGILQEALKQLQLQLQLTVDSNMLFQRDRHPTENRASYSEAEHAALTEQQLVEALTRESELKGRIQTLIASVSQSQKISDEKYEHLHNNIKELQKSNLNLTQMLEQSKRKYQARIRKLEQKVMDMSTELERHDVEDRFQSTTTATTTKTLQHDNVPETTL